MGYQRELFDAVCSACKKDCKIPFRYDPARPVYCSTCWQERRVNREQPFNARKNESINPSRRKEAGEWAN
ncbi:hypothetical protein MUP77_09400 [Candidatus Bathyarchaeota archaeon]|nr:hypothetical protein [Candidatus Bathyarchaeota archaeon]